MFRTRKKSIVIQTTLTSDNRTCLERSIALKPTRKKLSGLLAVVLGLTTAVASVGLLSENMPAFAQNYPQPNAQVPVANPPVMQAVPAVNPLQLLQQNNRLMIAARTSLAGGDVVTAEQYYQQAVALNAPYTDRDDRPDFIKPLIEGHKNWLILRKTHGDTEQVRRLRAENLTQQAEGFCRHNNLEMAEKLANDAVSQNVGFSIEMVNRQLDPQTLLKKINDAKLLQAEQTNTLGNPNGAMLVSGATMRQAQEMQPVLQQARQLLREGRVAEAEKLAERMVAMNVPESAFETIGDNPTRLMLDIVRMRNQVNPNTLPGMQHAIYSPQFDRNQITSVQGTTTTPTTVPGNTPVTSPAATPGQAPTPGMSDVTRQASEFEFAAEVRRQITRSQQLMSEPIPKMNEAITNLQDMRTKIEASELSPDMKRSQVLLIDRELMQMEDFRAKHGAAIDLAQNNADAYAKITEERQQQSYVEMKLKEYNDEYSRLYRQERYVEAAAVAEKARAIAPKNPIVDQMDYQSMMAGRVQEQNDINRRREAGVYNVFTDQLRSTIVDVNDTNLMVGPGPANWAKYSQRTGIDTVGDEQSEAEVQIYRALEQPITFTTNGRKPLRAVVEELGRQMQINIMIDTQAIVDANMGDSATASDIPVELNAIHQVKLRSALNMMLGQVGLSYTVRDESLFITTPKRARAELKWKAYYVGDLVMPYENAPKILPKSGMERYKEAMDIALGRNTGFGVNNSGPMFAPIQPVSYRSNTNDQSGMSRMPSNVLAQTLDSGYRPGGFGGNYGGFGGNYGGYGNNGYENGRMGSAGGGADFGELISLIMDTIDPDSWRDGGQGTGRTGTPTLSGEESTTEQGEATIREYYNSLTLIIRQTEENHQKISDLLKQLRKMNDIQINVEVRFITIRDDFFESIGMDFDFGFRNSQASKYAGLNTQTDTTNNNTTNNTNSTNSSAFTNAVKKGTLIAGLKSSSDPTQPPNFSSDLSISANQNSFGLSVPTFGSYDPAAGASLGFAILSDIETYFFMSAAQGDSRSNVLQAPKVSLINGQMATVTDTTDRYFVTSLVPVVGDFSVAYQPVVQAIPEGTMLWVNAVVSSDRRYVRINLLPVFTALSDTVSTFTWDGGGVTGLGGSGSGSSAQNDSGLGATVQQPIFTMFNVETAVSVPDGGTILMGGVKRLSEGRKEYGVPMINKIPYLKRLFSNTAVGRETQSMMIMVTPHIIIQEEYEDSMNTATETR